MYVVGLTGAMGCGKSTVARLLAGDDGKVLLLDADQLAREAVVPGSAGWRRVVQRFGPAATQGEGPLEQRPLNRRWLAERVFGSEEDRRFLESTLHPEVWLRMKRALSDWSTEHPAGVAVLDVPLLFETAQEGRCDWTVAVLCGDQRMSRLAGRGGGMSETARRGAMAGQWTEEEKRRRADGVIDNGGDLEATRHQAAALRREMTRRAEAGWGAAWPTHWPD